MFTLESQPHTLEVGSPGTRCAGWGDGPQQSPGPGPGSPPQLPAVPAPCADTRSSVGTFLGLGLGLLDGPAPWGPKGEGLCLWLSLGGRGAGSFPPGSLPMTKISVAAGLRGGRASAPPSYLPWVRWCFVGRPRGLQPGVHPHSRRAGGCLAAGAGLPWSLGPWWNPSGWSWTLGGTVGCQTLGWQKPFPWAASQQGVRILGGLVTA